MCWPRQLDTMLYSDFDKEGIDLSGGEAQKMAILRSLLRPSSVVILDEPTAALDPQAAAVSPAVLCPQFCIYQYTTEEVGRQLSALFFFCVYVILCLQIKQ